MMNLKAEKQQREDFETVAMKLENELMEMRHLLAVEKHVRATTEERLLEEHRNTAKLEQTAHSKIEKVTKKKVIFFSPYSIFAPIFLLSLFL